MPGQNQHIHKNVSRALKRNIFGYLLRSRRALAALGLLALMVAPMLQPQPVAAQGSDWCMILDLRYNTFGAFIYYGDYAEGSGIATGPGGIGEFNISNIYTVSASSVTVTFRAASGSPGNVNIEAETDAFGIEHVGEDADQVTINPGVSPTASITLDRTATDEDGAEFNMSLAASSTVYVESIIVQGSGANPMPPGSFYGNSAIPCASATATPTQTPTRTNTLPPSPTRTASNTRTPSLTPTITNTRTPSQTPTASNTPTPSLTPTIDPTCLEGEIHFEDTDDDLPYIEFLGDVGMPGRTGNGLVSQRTSPTSQYALVLIPIPDDPTIHLYGMTVWRNIVVGGSGSGLGVEVYMIWYNEDFEEVGRSVEGHGYTGDWEQEVYADVDPPDDAAYIGFSAAAFISDGGVGMAIDDIVLTFIDCSGPPTRTPTRTATVTAYPPSGTPSPSSTALIISSPTLAITESPSGTPVGEPTETPLPSPTFLPSPTAIAPSEDEDQGERQIGNIITDLYTWLANSFNGFARYISSVVMWGQGTLRNLSIQINNFWQAVLNFLRQLERLLRDILLIVNLLLQILRHLLEVLMLWFDQMTNVTRSIILAYQAATPNPIPFLPQCVSAPLESPLCALWYILQYTIFGGTLGGIVLQLMLIAIDLAVTFQFVRHVQSLLRTIREIFR